jgi:hypothetical protein
MHNLGNQTRHFIFKNGYLLHQAIRFTGLVHNSFRLTLHQRQMTFEVRNPRQVLNASARRTRSRRSRSVKRIGRRRPTTTIHRSTSTLTLEGKKTRGNNSETQSSTTFHKGKVFTKSTSSLTDFQVKFERVHYIKKKRRL